MIFLTSKDGEFDEALGLDLGADDYIAKPFSHQLLARRIKAVLRRANSDPALIDGDDATDQKPLNAASSYSTPTGRLAPGLASRSG